MDYRPKIPFGGVPVPKVTNSVLISGPNSQGALNYPEIDHVPSVGDGTLTDITARLLMYQRNASNNTLTLGDWNIVRQLVDSSEGLTSEDLRRSKLIGSMASRASRAIVETPDAPQSSVPFPKELALRGLFRVAT